MARTRFELDAQALSAVGVTAAAFVLYAATACRTVYFGDSGELIAAAHALGVAHPPGYPLYTVLGKAALALPFGEPALRVNLLSALFASLTAGGLAWAAGRLTGSTRAGVGAGLAIALSSMWTVATVAEVYTLHLCLVVLVLVSAIVIRDAEDSMTAARGILALGVLLGAGLGHRPTIVLALPAAVWIAFPTLRRRRSAGSGVRLRTAILAGVVSVAIPALLYGYLVFRSRADPVANWGRPDDVRALLAHVGTQAYGFYAVGPAGWSRPEAWGRVGATLLESFGYLGIALALIGVVGGRRGGGRGLLVPLALLAVPALFFGLSYATEDVEVLFLPLVLAVAFTVGMGVAEAERRLPRGPLLASTLTVALLATGLVRGLPRNDLSDLTAARDYGRDMLEVVAPNGVLFVEGDDAFVLAYLSQVLGERPDIRIYDRNGVMFRDETREPGSVRRPGETPLAFRVRREQELILGRRSAPIYFMTWPGYGLPGGFGFEPSGILYRVQRPGEVPNASPPTVDHEQDVRAHAELVDTAFVRAVAATYPLMRGERALYDGELERALAAFDEASRVGGDSETTHNYLGTIFGRLGDYRRAIREFETAIRIQPVSIRAWNNLALARAYSGDAEGAREALRRSLALEPAQPEAAAQLNNLSR